MESAARLLLAVAAMVDAERPRDAARLLRWLWNLMFRSVCWEKAIFIIGGLG